jgi:hypothetical protein
MNDFFDGEWKSNDKPLYTKLPQGETKLRVMSRALLGWEGWYQNKPVRFAYDYKINAEEYGTLDKDNYDSAKSKWKQFAVCVVYNYKEEAVQYWQFSQKQIKDQLMSLASDKDYGPLTSYDIKVKREGEKMETKYTITPLPPKAVSKEVEAAVAEAGLDPNQIFSDKKNQENVANFKAAAGAHTPAVDVEDLDNIPF